MVLFVNDILIRRYKIGFSYESTRVAISQLFPSFSSAMNAAASSPTLSFIVSAIKSSIAQSSLVVGKSIHGHSIKTGFCSHTTLCNHLLNLYSKCESPHDARNLFDEMPERNLISYSTLISFHSRSGDPRLALSLGRELQSLALVPNQFVFSSSIVACSKLNKVILGKQVHAQVISSGFGSDPFVSTALVDMYSKLRDPGSAVSVFSRCPMRDLVMCNSMVSGYVSFGSYEEAVRLFGEARSDFGFKPTEFSFGSLVKAGSELGKDVGEQIHGLILKSGFDSNCFVGTSLIDMYGRFGDTESLEVVFKGVSYVDVALYNAMIVGYSKNCHDEIALECFIGMRLMGMDPNECTFSSALKACAGLKSLDLGRMIHGVVKRSKFDQDLVVNTALIDMYMKCGMIKESRIVFDHTHERNTISYNSMVFGLGQNGNFGDALNLFINMIREQICVDLATFVALMTSCLGQEWCMYVHGIKHGFGSDPMFENALLDSLLKRGASEEALEFFEKMKERNVISWTTIISGLTHLGLNEGAIEFFKAMRFTKISPNSFTLSSVLKACGNLAGLAQGRCVHGFGIKLGFMDEFTNSSLLDMYAKCGVLGDSRRLFDELNDKDIVLWNTMIAGYSQHGYGHEAIELYNMMVKNNVQPNNVTLVSLLSACSHCGLLENGVQLFEQMVSKHGITPCMEHYACMVDMFGRSGMLDRAKCFINDMPFEANASVWTVFLAACKLNGNLNLAEFARDR